MIAFAFFSFNTSLWRTHALCFFFHFNSYFENAHSLQPHMFAFFPSSPLYNFSSPLYCISFSNVTQFLSQMTQSVKNESSQRLRKTISTICNCLNKKENIALLRSQEKKLSKIREHLCYSQNQQSNWHTLCRKQASNTQIHLRISTIFKINILHHLLDVVDVSLSNHINLCIANSNFKWIFYGSSENSMYPDYQSF